MRTRQAYFPITQPQFSGAMAQVLQEQLLPMPAGALMFRVAIPMLKKAIFQQCMLLLMMPEALQSQLPMSAQP